MGFEGQGSGPTFFFALALHGLGSTCEYGVMKWSTEKRVRNFKILAVCLAVEPFLELIYRSFEHELTWHWAIGSLAFYFLFMSGAYLWLHSNHNFSN